MNRKYKAVLLILLLLLLLPSGCKKPVDTSPAYRTLIVLEDNILTGTADQALTAEFERMYFTRREIAAGQGWAEMDFELNKSDLDINGMIYLGRGAAGYFGMALEEIDGVNATDMMDLMVHQQILDTLGKETATRETNGLTWIYGLGTYEEGGVFRLILHAYAKADKGLIIYVNAQGRSSSKEKLENACKKLDEWLATIRLDKTVTDSARIIKTPFAGKILSANDWDILNPGNPELIVTADDKYLRCTYVAGTDDYRVFCYLDNKEIVSSKLEQAKALPATSLSSPMKWQYNITDNHMFAWAETDNDTILFEMRIESAGSGKNMQESFDKALEWLKSVEYK